MNRRAGLYRPGTEGTVFLGVMIDRSGYGFPIVPASKRRDGLGKEEGCASVSFYQRTPNQPRRHSAGSRACGGNVVGFRTWSTSSSRLPMRHKSQLGDKLDELGSGSWGGNSRLPRLELSFASTDAHDNTGNFSLINCHGVRFKYQSASKPINKNAVRMRVACGS